jgi:hypothetical protein
MRAYQANVLAHIRLLKFSIPNRNVSDIAGDDDKKVSELDRGTRAFTPCWRVGA